MANFEGRYSPFGAGGAGGGVTSLDGLTGALSLVAGTGISIVDGVSSITITNTSPAGVTGNLTDAGTDGIVITGGTGAVNGSGTSIAQHVADASHNGYLSSADWSTFNSKQSALTLGNLTDAGTDGITVTGGTGAVVGSGTSLSQHVADASHNGYLSSTDWSTFNNKQTALTIGNLTDAGTDGITVTGGTGSVIGSGTSIAQHVADTSHNGYLSSTDWNTFNGKGSGTVTGSGASTQVTVWTSSSAVTGYAGFTSDSSGNVVTNTVKSGSGSVSTNGIQVGAAGTGLYSSGTNILDFSTAGTKFLEVSATQGVTYTPGLGVAGYPSIDVTSANTNNTQIAIRNTSTGSGYWSLQTCGSDFGSATGSFLFRKDAGSIEGFCIGRLGSVGAGAVAANLPGGQNSTLASYANADVNITGTTTVNSSTSITITSGKALAELAVGDQVSVSSATTTFATVTAIGSDTSITVNTALGNGTSQTIKKRWSIFNQYNRSGTMVACMDPLGRQLIGSLATTGPIGVQFQVDNGSSGISPLLLTSNNHNRIEFNDSGAYIQYGTTSGQLTQVVPATVSSYSITWPSAQGAASTFLENDGSGNLSWATRNITDLTSFTPTITSFGTVSSAAGNWRRIGDSMEVNITFTTGTTAAAIGSVTIPNSQSIDSAKILVSNSTSGDGQAIGTYFANSASAQGAILTATGTSTTLVYFGPGNGSTLNLRPQNASGIIANTVSVSLSFKVPISGWTI